MDAVYQKGVARAGTLAVPDESAPLRRRAVYGSKAETFQPNFAVRCAFYLSIVAIPFLHLYIPGTGERLGIKRVIQVLMLLAMFSRPRVSLRLVPVCLVWMLAYCGVRIVWGMWLAPEYSRLWWPSS